MRIIWDEVKSDNIYSGWFYDDTPPRLRVVEVDHYVVELLDTIEEGVYVPRLYAGVQYYIYMHPSWTVSEIVDEIADKDVIDLRRYQQNRSEVL